MATRLSVLTDHDRRLEEMLSLWDNGKLSEALKDEACRAIPLLKRVLDDEQNIYVRGTICQFSVNPLGNGKAAVRLSVKVSSKPRPVMFLIKGSLNQLCQKFGSVNARENGWSQMRKRAGCLLQMNETGSFRFVSLEGIGTDHS